MSELLNIKEVIDFAVQIEQNGYKFYNETRGKFEDKDLKELFRFLGDEELKHENIFKNLAKEAGSFTPNEKYAGEYSAYVRDFLKIHALGNEKALKEQTDAVKNTDDAVKMAMEFEKDSIVLFSMLKKYLGGKGEELVDAVIQEELSHIHKINNFYNRMK